MKKKDVKIGGEYLTKVSGSLVRVRVTGEAPGAGIFEPAPPSEPIAPRARRRASTGHVVRCPCGVELIYPGAAPAGAACSTCETTKEI